MHPGAGFPDLTYDHFVRAAYIAAATLPRAGEIGVGQAVLACVEATVAACGTNVNLGVALLLAPLCAVPRDVPLAEGVDAVLAGTTVADAAAVYEAIRLANPGGLGDAAEQDVRREPTVTLTAAMTLAADRDRVARQYARGFAGVQEDAADLTRRWSRRSHDWEDCVLRTFCRRLALAPDSHIVRRCGRGEAERVAVRARSAEDRTGVRGSPLVGSAEYRRLDRFLRGGVPRRNPGTTADLTAAALFWAGREGLITLPTEAELAAHAARTRAGRVE